MSAIPDTAAPMRQKKSALVEDRSRRSRRKADALGPTCQNSPSPEKTKEGYQLPKGWRWVTFGDVAESMKNGIYKPASSYADDGLACLRMYNIGDGKIVWRDIKRMRLSENEIQEYELLPGDILVNRVNSRELVGKSVAIPTGLERCVFESKNIRVRIRRDLVSPEFVSYRLLSAGSRYFTQNAQQVVGMASISQPQVARFPLPLPPLPEQRRIVAEIEKQFTRLEAGVAALRRVQANLKRYRAAVLKAACEGRLVPTEAELHRQQKTGNRKLETGEQLLQLILTERRKRWSGRGQYNEPVAPDTANLPSLPEGWTWATADQLTDENRAITYGVIKLGAPVPDGVHVLRSSDVRHLRLDLQDVKRVSPEIAGEYQRTFLKGGEVLITVRGTLGGVVVAPAECAGFNISREVAMLAMVQPAAAKITAIFIGSAPLQRWLLQRAKGIAYTGINIETLKELPVPLPPQAEQSRIVSEVECRLSVVEELESVVAANLQRASRLRQSILQKAFSGELCL